LCIHKGKIENRDANEKETEQDLNRWVLLLHTHVRVFTSFQTCTLATFQGCENIMPV